MDIYGSWVTGIGIVSLLIAIHVSNYGHRHNSSEKERLGDNIGVFGLLATVIGGFIWLLGILLK